METDTHTVVIGGGVMGSAAAWALARRGIEVLLLEQYAAGHRFGSSHGSARIFRLAYAEPFYVRLARAALPLWRELEAESGERVLELTGGVDHGSQEQLVAIRRALREVGEPAELVPPGEVERRWPGLRIDGAALVQESSGRIDADGAVRAFHRAAGRSGAVVRHEAAVEEIRLDGDGVLVRTADGAVRARRAAVAVGGWTTRLLASLIPVPPLRVTQEQPVHFRPSDPDLPWPSFIHHPYPGGGAPQEAAYGLAAPEGVKVSLHGAGPPVDPARRRDDVGRVDAPALWRLRDYARAWLPGVDPDQAEPMTCLYTLTADHDFLVDRVGPLTVAAGFSGHGFKFAPAIGELVADLVLGRRGTPERFALGRTRTPPPPGPVLRVR